MATIIKPPPGFRSLGTFQLTLFERWAMAFVVGLLLFSLTLMELWRFAGGEMWFMLFLLAGLCMTPVILGIMQGHMDLFEPIVMVCAAYFLYMVWAPSVDWISGLHVVFGTDIPSTIKTGTLHTLVAIISLLVGYYVRFDSAAQRPRQPAKPGPEEPLRDYLVDEKKDAAAVKYALIMTAVAVVCLGLTMSLTGWNWTRLLTLGQFGGAVTGVWLIEQNPFLNYLFLTLEWFMPVTIILIAFVKPSRAKKVLLTTGFMFIFVMYMTLGFRYRVLMLLMGPVSYWYLTRRKRPGLAAITASGVFLVIMIGLISGTRDDTRAGRAMDTEAFEIQESGTRFANDLRIYPPYYQLLSTFPYDHDYLWGSSFLYVFFSPIPRALWAGKPDAPPRLILRTAYGERAVQQGLAYPNIGEFYVNFGIAGEILGMCLFGYLLRRLWDYTRRNSHDRWVIIAYSLWFPFLVQVVSRGYFVQIAQEIAFIFLPVYVGKRVFGYSQERKQLARAEMSAARLPRQISGLPAR